MANEAPAQPSQQPAAAPSNTPEPSGLEQVYSQFGIEEQAQEFQPQSPTPAPASPVAPKIPDPFSPEFSQYQAQLANGMTVLDQRTNAVMGKLNALERQAQQRAVDADIKQAVGVITETAGIDPDIAEVALEAQARKDPKFLQVWNNRQKNPKAFQAALKAFAAEAGEKYKVRQDPQLVENQRAVAASRQSMATTQNKGPNGQFDSMSYEERRQETARLRRMG